MDPLPSPASVPSAWDTHSPVRSWKIHPSEVVPRPPVSPQAVVLAEPLLLCCPVGWRLPPCPPSRQRLCLIYLLQLRRTREVLAESQHEPGRTSRPPHRGRGPRALTPSSHFPPHLPLCACAWPRPLHRHRLASVTDGPASTKPNKFFPAFVSLSSPRRSTSRTSHLLPRSQVPPSLDSA